MSGGWGASPWGSAPWGGSAPSGLVLVSAVSVAENVVRVGFNRRVYFSALLDVPDASNADAWAVTPVSGTVGYDGLAARGVAVAHVDPASVPGTMDGSVLDLTLDRPMSPYPAAYAVANALPIYSDDLTHQLPPGQQGTTPALFRVLNVPDPTSSITSRDLANPQTFAQAQGSTIAQPQVTALGSFGYDGSGSYALDSKDAGLRKRLTRRTFTKKNGFVHLPGYGVGITDYGKQLAKASTRAQLAAECEAQYAQEPEIAQVRVLTRLDPKNPSLLRLSVYLKKKSGQTARYAMVYPVQ